MAAACSCHASTFEGLTDKLLLHLSTKRRGLLLLLLLPTHNRQLGCACRSGRHLMKFYTNNISSWQLRNACTTAVSVTERCDSAPKCRVDVAGYVKKMKVPTENMLCALHVPDPDVSPTIHLHYIHECFVATRSQG